MDELKPCPFCGSLPQVWIGSGYDLYVYGVACISYTCPNRYSDKGNYIHRNLSGNSKFGTMIEKYRLRKAFLSLSGGMSHISAQRYINDKV